MKPMETLGDLIDEAKVRAVWWGLCIFGISYFLTHTSKSMWMNVPIAVLILFALRYLSYEVELRWKIRPLPRQSFLSILQKEQISLNDPRLSSSAPIQRWTGKIDSPLIENAVRDFTDKIVQDFVVDLWYATITPDMDAPELIRGMILNAIGEISGRIKNINLVELLTSDIVQLVGNHLDLFRKNQGIIGIEVMGTLSSEERDERLKYHLVASKELHPALVSPESEYKVLQRLVEGILAVVLEPAETPIVRCISRELLTCLVLEPVMNLVSPGYINELIELVFLNIKDDKNGEGHSTGTGDAEAFSNDSNFMGGSRHNERELIKNSSSNPSGDIKISSATGELSHIQPNMLHDDPIHTIHPKPADWARVLDAATQRRTQVLTPENLDNMWTKGRNYQKKDAKISKGASTCDIERLQPSKGGSAHCAQGWEGDSGKHLKSTKNQLKRSSSTSDLRKESDVNNDLTNKLGKTVASSELFNPGAKGVSESIILSEASLKAPKIKCRVVGAYFEKAGSNSFAVYSIAVTDVENKSWFVKRRYRNFERLHRHLKDIPNYNLHLPPKRFLSSSIDDYFVHQRCILLDKYLQDLLSIANIAEQHEVWDFLSTTSKNYSFGKATSVMKTLAVNVDDAVDDIVRQFRGVSGGLRRVVASPPSSFGSTHMLISEATSTSGSSTWNEEKSINYDSMDITQSLSDEEAPERGSSASINGWHSDNETDATHLAHSLVKRDDFSRSLDSEKSTPLEKNDQDFVDQDHVPNASAVADSTTVPVVVPPEWSPPNVSVPILNLVDNIFQLNRRGWIRRQVFWISKQILQLMMEDAIDDWLLRQINWLRRDDVIAQGICWVQDILWPNGTFFIKLSSSKESSEIDFQEVQKSTSGTNRVPRGTKSLSFEEQLEAARRASDVKKMIISGAPTTLVSLIGAKQYKRCAKDVYYFMQSQVCIKQLAYGMLELVLASLFPELRDVILDIHQSRQPPTT